MAKQTAINEQPNNIQWVGKAYRTNPDTGEKELAPIDAPEEFHQPPFHLQLPKGIENGAYMEDAEVLKATFPDFFKTPVEKGSK